MSQQRVDFYLLGNDNALDEQLLACRLLEKAWIRGHNVFVLCQTQQDAEKLDELLWTFKDDSFIPHNIQGEGPEPPPPIQIGYEKEPRGFTDILLNLSPTIEPWFPRFKRIIEIVAANDSAKHISRAHYREYRKLECNLHTHEV